MANSSLDLTSLDFDNLKNNFVTFLKSQNTFKDYSFEGSNMNVLLDVMTYNTFLNSFYLNMVASEMFLDSAQKIDSVVSHAKELNYVPQSRKSAEANLNIIFDTNIDTRKLTIPKGTIFTGTNSNGSFTFVTSYTATYTSPNTTFYANNVEIYEGSYMNQSYVVDYTIENQKFIINSPNIDLTSLVINVIEDNGASNTVFARADNLYGLKANSEIYFIQATQNNNYEIIFGDGLFGRKPKNGAVINANYRITNGPMADGISDFNLSQNLDDINGGTVIVTSMIPQANSSSGAFAESIEEIRYRAPRWYATQERGVSNDDYKSLIMAKFGSYIQDINVFGGQEVEPKQYGSVIITIKPYKSTAIPNYLKSKINSYLLDKSQMRTIINDPEYLYLKVDSTIQYDKTKTSLYIDDLQNLALSSILQFSYNNLEKFNNDFRYSRFVTNIDSVDTSFVSNQTDIHLIKRLAPLYNRTMSFSFSFNNASQYEARPYTGLPEEPKFEPEPVLESSPFTYLHTDGREYPLCFIKDDYVGNLVVYTFLNGIYTVLNNKIGTIKYTTGEVRITNLTVTYYDQFISLYLKPLNKDVIVDKNKILLIEAHDVNIDIIEKLQ